MLMSKDYGEDVLKNTRGGVEEGGNPSSKSVERRIEEGEVSRPSGMKYEVAIKRLSPHRSKAIDLRTKFNTGSHEICRHYTQAGTGAWYSSIYESETYEALRVSRGRQTRKVRLNLAPSC